MGRSLWSGGTANEVAVPGPDKICPLYVIHTEPQATIEHTRFMDGTTWEDQKHSIFAAAADQVALAERNNKLFHLPRHFITGQYKR